MKAFEGWKDAKQNGVGAGKSFCWENFLSPVTLQMMEDMRIQFLDLLSNIGFLDKSRGANVSSFKGSFVNRFMFCLFAALFPNYKTIWNKFYIKIEKFKIDFQFSAPNF